MILSDEQDSSESISESDWITYLNQSKTLDVQVTNSEGTGVERGQPISVSISSIVGIDNGLSTCYGDGEEGVSYTRVTDAVGGQKVSICDLDWTPAMASVGDTATALGNEFRLMYPAIAETILIEVESKSHQQSQYDAESGAFVYSSDNQSVVFNNGYVPGQGATIGIYYEIDCADASVSDTEVCN